MNKTNENRFSDRVDNYVKYRPHYPNEVYLHLLENKIISSGSVVADIGAGTGISAELFLKHNHKVFLVDPNQAMLDAANNYLIQYKNFETITAPAEKTGLNDNSIDVIICAQAFHWFNREACKKEFKRILKPEGKVVLIWNDRKTPTEAGFLGSYEDFLQFFGTDYKEVNHKNVQDTKIFDEFFGKNKYQSATFQNFQDLNFDGLKGRVLSSSYMPGEGSNDFDFMMQCLKKIFMRYQQNARLTDRQGTVRLEYDTILYYGPLN